MSTIKDRQVTSLFLIIMFSYIEAKNQVFIAD